MGATLEVLEVRGPVLVEDSGRPGRMHEGVPPGGALVPELLAAANGGVGNAWGAAALECYGRVVLRVAGRGAWVSVDGRTWRVAEGELVEVPAPEEAVVRYVAVEGGLAVPEVLGGRGALPVARLGGWQGRALRRGDVLPVGAPRGTAQERAEPVRLEPQATVRVTVGPDVERLVPGALEALCSGAFTVQPASDRVGMRLRGPRLELREEAAGLSGPMVRGAVQVTPSGEAIVLGPDHPTIGGYAVLAVVARADWGVLAMRRPGAQVHFRQVSVEEAREAWRQGVMR